MIESKKIVKIKFRLFFLLKNLLSIKPETVIINKKLYFFLFKKKLDPLI